MLAQFGGVTLAFAFLATIGSAGLVTDCPAQPSASTSTGGGLAVRASGLILVYTYFQIPLMVIVFLPALDGLRPQWREAAESLGGITWQYWRHVAGPLLLPAFLGSLLLLFANAFSAYATAAALVSQGARSCRCRSAPRSPARSCSARQNLAQGARPRDGRRRRRS